MYFLRILIFICKTRIDFFRLNFLGRHLKLRAKNQKEAFSLFLIQAVRVNEPKALGEIFRVEDSAFLIQTLFNLKTSQKDQFNDILRAISTIAHLRGLTNAAPPNDEDLVLINQKLNSLTNGESASQFLKRFEKVNKKQHSIKLRKFLTLIKVPKHDGARTDEIIQEAINLNTTLQHSLRLLFGFVPVSHFAHVLHHQLNRVLNFRYVLHHQLNRVLNLFRPQLLRTKIRSLIVFVYRWMSRRGNDKFGL